MLSIRCSDGFPARRLTESEHQIITAEFRARHAVRCLAHIPLSAVEEVEQSLADTVQRVNRQLAEGKTVAATFIAFRAMTKHDRTAHPDFHFPSSDKTRVPHAYKFAYRAHSRSAILIVNRPANYPPVTENRRVIGIADAKPRPDLSQSNGSAAPNAVDVNIHLQLAANSVAGGRT